MADQISTLPLTHLAIICDGNRRWAKERGLPAWEGHRRGSEMARQILEACRDRNVKYVTMWGFSTENWKRDPKEVAFLMTLFREMLVRDRKELIKNNVRFRHLGRKDRLDAALINEINRLEEETKDFTEWNFQTALDYGGRDEIIRATKKIAEKVSHGELSVQDITEAAIQQNLDTVGIPDPDLILRTSGEQRLSGYLPFQAVYAELAFVPFAFPDLTKERVYEVIDSYATRNRRFGAG